MGGTVVAAVLLFVLQLYLFISSIISVQADTQLPDFLNVPIVVVAICASIFSMFSYIVKVPLPYWDYSILDKLTELESDDPERAKQVWTSIAQSDLARERRNVGILQLIVVMAAAILPQVALSGAKFFSEYYMLVPLLTIPIIVFAFVAPMLDAFERWSFRVQCNKGGTEVPGRDYLKWKKRMLISRMVICLILGICLFVSFEYNA